MGRLGACCKVICGVVAIYVVVGISVAFLANLSLGHAPVYNVVKTGDADALSALLKTGADPDAPGTPVLLPRAVGWLVRAETPLEAASGRGDEKMVKLLLKAGATADARSTAGWLCKRTRELRA